MKSIRQDLVLQQVKDELAVEAWEFHTELCLEENDLSEFSQCQTVLRQLHEAHRCSSAEADASRTTNESIFTAYRILFWLIRGDHLELLKELALLTTECKNSE